MPIALCDSKVIAGSIEAVGLCQIPFNSDAPVLIGMDFLRKTRNALVITSQKFYWLGNLSWAFHLESLGTGSFSLQG